MQFPGVQHGLNTNDPASLIAPTESAELLNFVVLEGGVAKVRPPIFKYSDQACGAAVVTVGAGLRSGNATVFVTDADDKIYYMDSALVGQATPVEIGTLIDGDCVITPYNGVTIVCDGGRVKYIDDGSDVYLCYDNGSGSSAYQTNNLSDVSDTFLALGNGTNTRIAQKFTSQSWDTGFTIPPTTISVNLSANGTPNASAVNAVLRLVSDDSTLATVELVADASSLSTEDTYTADFADGTITTEMAKSSAMYISLEHTGGDASNYVKVHCNNCSTGGLAFHYAGSWTADTDKNCILGMKPGMPPLADFAEVHKGRLFVGVLNGGLLYYSNRTHLDWSTTDLGGYIGVVDDDSSSFGMGAIASLYGNLYIFSSTLSYPYLSVLTGDTPAEYEVKSIFQNAYAHYHSTISTGNDLWFFMKNGMSALSGVQEFGDLRYADYSRQIFDKMKDWSPYVDKVGYDPTRGLLLLQMDEYERTIVFNLRAVTRDPSGSGARYPISEFQHYREDLTSATYKWTENSGEYYVEAAAGGDPGFDVKPEYVIMDGVVLTEGTAGSLNDHEWDWAQDPGASYNTIYIKDATGDPDTSGVSIKTVLIPSSFCYFFNKMLIGSNDGYVYWYSTEDSVNIVPIGQEYQDNDAVDLEIDWRGKNYQFNDYTTLTKQQVLLDGDDGATFSLSIYKNDDLDTAAKTYSHTETPGTKKYKDMRCTGYSFQPRIHGVTLNATQPLFRGAVFEYEKS